MCMSVCVCVRERERLARCTLPERARRRRRRVILMPRCHLEPRRHPVTWRGEKLGLCGRETQRSTLFVCVCARACVSECQSHFSPVSCVRFAPKGEKKKTLKTTPFIKVLSLCPETYFEYQFTVLTSGTSTLSRIKKIHGAE